jgi:hypothetical protein
MIILALFASSFVLVFALGLQSLNVNNGHYWAAVFTSIFIGSSQLVMFKLAPNANLSEMIAFVSGGPLGIIGSMKAHPYLVRVFKRGRRV